MNPATPASAEPIQTGYAEPAVQNRTQDVVGDVAGDWLCAWCLNRVANERDRFQYNGQDEFVFSNPDGIRFEIITFSQTLACRQSGLPTIEFTWFAGHAWSYCHCEGCGQHLGWYYTGPHEFAGLIRDRLVRSLWVRN